MYRMLQVDLDDGAPLDCYSAAELAIHKGDHCVLDMRDLLEFGTVSAVKDEVEELPEPGSRLPEVLRRATLQDQAKASENDVVVNLARKTCVQKIEETKLDMCLVGIRYSFDRKKLTVFFSAEHRVDFRELVKALSGELNTRVEMRQIGPRDAAAAIGGFGPCGRRQCCSSWLSEFTPVTIRMAKTQGISLNPNSLNGMCGRLKCCLRYENSGYRKADERLPPCGVQVRSPFGEGQVVERDLLKCRVRIRLADDQIVDVDAEDVDPVRHARGRGKP